MPPRWDEEGTVPPVLGDKKHPSPTGRRKTFHVINTSRRRLFGACEKERGEMGTDFRHLQSTRGTIMSEITIDDLHLCLCIFRQLAVYCKVVTILHHINISRGWFGSRIIGLQSGCGAVAKKTAFLWFNKGCGPALMQLQIEKWMRTDKSPREINPIE